MTTLIVHIFDWLGIAAFGLIELAICVVLFSMLVFGGSFKVTVTLKGPLRFLSNEKGDAE